MKTQAHAPCTSSWWLVRKMFAFLQSWNLQEPWIKLCFIWLFITACPLPPVCPSWKLLLLCQISECSCCRYIFLEVSLRVLFFLLQMGCREGLGAKLRCLLRNALLCNREEILVLLESPVWRLSGAVLSEAVVSNPAR